MEEKREAVVYTCWVCDEVLMKTYGAPVIGEVGIICPKCHMLNRVHPFPRAGEAKVVPDDSCPCCVHPDSPSNPPPQVSAGRGDTRGKGARRRGASRT